MYFLDKDRAFVIRFKIRIKKVSIHQDCNDHDKQIVFIVQVWEKKIVCEFACIRKSLRLRPTVHLMTSRTTLFSFRKDKKTDTTIISPHCYTEIFPGRISFKGGGRSKYQELWVHFSTKCSSKYTAKWKNFTNKKNSLKNCSYSYPHKLTINPSYPCQNICGKKTIYEE